MKKLLLAAIISLFFAGTALAAPMTWSETLGSDADVYVGWFDSFTYTHDIKNDGFTPFQDLVVDYELTIGIFDNDRRGKEIIKFDLPGWSADETHTYSGNWSHTVESLGMSIAGWVQLNLFGTLDVTVKSIWGDFYLDYSTLVANGYSPVPEPGTLLLLGSGLAGLALYRRRSMNK